MSARETAQIANGSGQSLFGKEVDAFFCGEDISSAQAVVFCQRAQEFAGILILSGLN
jgi:hypothetical protein